MASFYLDEGIAERLAALLIARRHPAVSTRDAGNKGLPDPQQLAFARATERVLITCNGRDFAALHEALVTWAALWGVSRVSAHHGILLVPTGNEIDAEDLAAIVVELVEREPDLRGRCFTWRWRDGWQEFLPPEQPDLSTD